MIAEFHRLTKFPIKRGTALYIGITIDFKYIVRKVKVDDKHTAFAAEDITSRSVISIPVQSPVDITLIYNFKGDKK